MSRLAGPVVQDLQRAQPGTSARHRQVECGVDARSRCHRRLLAVSAATRDWYQRMGLAGADIRVEYNGVDLVRFHPRSPSGYLHAELGIDRRMRLVGTIGQIGLRKGTDVFLAAMNRVAERWPDVHFLIGGPTLLAEGGSRGHSKQRVRQDRPRCATRTRALARRAGRYRPFAQ